MELANEGIMVDKRIINKRLLEQGLKSYRPAKKALINTENEVGEISMGCTA